MSQHLLKDHGSVDSSTGTIVPLGSSSVQSTQGYDSLAVVMERFLRIPRPSFARIRREITALIRKSLEAELSQLSSRWEAAASGTQKKISKQSHISESSAFPRRCIPPANLLRPPRGNLVCGTRDLHKELLVMRRLTHAERSTAAARLIRTLDPALPTHGDIALSLFLIATL